MGALRREGGDKIIDRFPKAYADLAMKMLFFAWDVREWLLAEAREKGIALKGTCRHIYLEGSPQHKAPKKFITQVFLPITNGTKA